MKTKTERGWEVERERYVQRRDREGERDEGEKQETKKNKRK